MLLFKLIFRVSSSVGATLLLHLAAQSHSYFITNLFYAELFKLKKRELVVKNQKKLFVLVLLLKEAQHSKLIHIQYNMIEKFSYIQLVTSLLLCYVFFFLFLSSSSILLLKLYLYSLAFKIIYNMKVPNGKGKSWLVFIYIHNAIWFRAYYVKSLYFLH